MTEQNKLAVRSGIQMDTLETLTEFASIIIKSRLAPKSFTTPEAVIVAIQMGSELGLQPLTSLRNIAVINGNAGIYGDAALALVRASGLLEDYSETMEGTGDNKACIVSSKRVKMSSPLVTRFSVSDAKKAQLWDKSGPWTQYADRMLMFRARGFNLRDNFGDVLEGFKTTEELGDYPQPGFENAKPANIMPDLQPKAEVKTPEPDVEPVIELEVREVTPQEKLAKFVTDLGHSFSLFMEWSIGTGRNKNHDAASFNELDTDLAVMFMKHTKRLTKELAVVAAAAEKGDA